MWLTEVPMVPGVGGSLSRPLNQRLVKARLRSCLARLGFASPLVLTTLPYTSWLIGDLPRRALVYYCTDDFSNWPSADRETLLQAECDLVNECDLIVAASRALEARFDDTGRCHYLPHGVDFEHFATAQTVDMLPTDLAFIPRPRIGFFGLIYEKIDFGLLRQLATRFSDCHLVLIGRVDYRPPEFARLPNVHFFGPQPYEELPKWIAGLDVLLLPYLMNDEMIRQSGPLKLRECLASGKPTVGVDIPDIRALEPFVRVGKDAVEFADQVAEALAESEDGYAVARRQDAVRGDSWENGLTKLRAYLDSVATCSNGTARPRRTNG
jgi:glycosyltransferase involved in cell wall biosynthesis